MYILQYIMLKTGYGVNSREIVYGREIGSISSRPSIWSHRSNANITSRFHFPHFISSKIDPTPLISCLTIYLPHKSQLVEHNRHLPTVQIINFWILPSSTYRTNHYILSTTIIYLPRKSTLSGQIEYVESIHWYSICGIKSSRFDVKLYWHMQFSSFMRKKLSQNMFILRTSIETHWYFVYRLIFVFFWEIVMLSNLLGQHDVMLSRFRHAVPTFLPSEATTKLVFGTHDQC